MADKTAIEWTDTTWNPIAGCSIVSPGCTNCYAMAQAARMIRCGNSKYDGTVRQSGGRAVWTGNVRYHEAAINDPIHWRRPRRIFVNSMSDLFHEEVAFDAIEDVFTVMKMTPHHSYQVLTKRAARLVELAPRLPWSNNVWMGVSVENADYLPRIDLLRKVPAKVRFLSLEPLLGPLQAIDLSGIHWVICGGESGPGFRQMEPDWARDIRDQCIAADVPFFFKQWSAPRAGGAGKVLDGREWCEFPISATA